MDLQELKDAANRGNSVVLVLPQRRVTGERVRMCRGGPLGELLCTNGSGLTVRFESKDVLAFIAKCEKEGVP